MCIALLWWGTGETTCTARTNEQICTHERHASKKQVSGCLQATRAHHVLSKGWGIDIGVELARHAPVREEADDVHHVPSGLGRRSDVPVCRASLRYNSFIYVCMDHETWPKGAPIKRPQKSSRTAVSAGTTGLLPGMTSKRDRDKRRTSLLSQGQSGPQKCCSKYAYICMIETKIWS